MRRALALLFVLLVVLAAWLATRHSETPSLPAQTPTPAAETPAPAPAALEAPPKEEPRVEAAAQAERAPVAAPQAEKTEPKLAELRGRFVLEGGAPAAGAAISLQGAIGNSERVMQFGKPKDWKDLSAKCDDDGRFVLRFDPPRAYQFFLESSYPGCVRAKWRWGEIEPASLKDLGETVLPRGGAVAGRVLDAQGNPMHESWSVSADARAISSGDGSDSSRAMAQVDLATGQYRMDGLPPGSVQLSAYSQLTNQIDGPKVEVRAGETVEADIKYTGPDNSRRIVVSTSTRPFYGFGHDVAEAVLSAPGQEPRKATKQPHSASSYGFDDLAPGSYSVSIDDPRFKPWRQDGVQPGQRVTAKLVGASSASLAVIDAATHTPVAHWALRVRFEHVNFSPNQYEVFGKDTEPPAGGLIEGLIPGADQTLIVVAEGYAPCELHVEGLKAGEVRPLTAELRKGATLLVRVLQSDGQTPIAGQKVTLDPFVSDEEAQHTSFRFLHPPTQREATSAADGNASFAMVAAGNYTLRAAVTPLLVAEIKGCEIAIEDTQKAVDLVLPPNAWLVGRVLGLEPEAAEGCTISALRTDLTEHERSLLRIEVMNVEGRRSNGIAADGSFRAGPFRAGKSQVSLQFPEVKVAGPGGGWSQAGTELALGELEIPTSGELRRDFDLHDKLPGRVEASVSVNGVPAANARVDVSSIDQVPRNGVISLDASGHGTSSPIPAGPVRFDIFAGDQDWSWTPPGAWTIASGQTLRVQWDVALAAGTLQLVEEATGLPLAERQVSISAEDAKGMVSWVMRDTDKQGKFEVKLVPAAYRLQFSYERGADGKPGPSPYADTRFDWTASGATQPVLKIAKKP